MGNPLCIGLELPALPVWVAASAGRRSVSPRSPVVQAAWHAADAAVEAGATCVWFADARRPGAAPACDPCTLAAAFAHRRRGALVGVAATFPHGRAPAVLARDVSTLDVLSGGGAAVLLRWEDEGGCDYLAEAAQVCRAVFREPSPVFEGRHVHVAGAVNRPAPIQPGGPPIVVDLPQAGGSATLARLLTWATAVVCSGAPDAVGAWRVRLDRLAPPHAGRPALLYRHVLDVLEGERAAPAHAARDAGADGVVLRLALARLPSGGAPKDNGYDALVRAVTELVRPWQC